jgi:hypothetical protein
MIIQGDAVNYEASVEIEEDGHTCLTWTKDANHILSISISPQGHVNFAYQRGVESRHGTELGVAIDCLKELIKDEN